MSAITRSRTHLLREQRRHDVVLVVVRQRDEQVHVRDVLVAEYVAVGSVAGEDERARQLMRQVFAALLARLDDLDLVLAAVVLLEDASEPQADVAGRRRS